MGSILILNGSPRPPRSNSKRYAKLFMDCCKADYCDITKANHQALCAKMEGYSDLVFVFPLYADGLPVTLLNFLKALEAHPPRHKPTVSVLINCGFLEYTQNDAAVSMMALFCKQNGYRLGSVLKIGSGEAILDKKFARSVERGRYASFHTTMPLPKSLFLKASTTYWTNYGKRNGVTKEEMETLKIE